MSLPQSYYNLLRLFLRIIFLLLRKKNLTQKRGTAIGAKFAPPYSILFMAGLEEEILREIELQPCLWWRYIDDIFLLWEHREEKRKEFIEHLNEKHPTKKFTAEWSQPLIKFPDVTVSLIGGKVTADSHQYLFSSYVTHITAKRESHTVKLFVLIESVQILIL